MASPGRDAHNPEVARVGEEIRRGADAVAELIVPHRIPASSLERLLADPRAYRDALLRPVPRKPQSAAVRGTLFHRYVEQRLGSTVPGGLFDPEDDYAEVGTTLSIEQWQERFEASEFAGLSPVAIEAELHLPVAGHSVVCKIDAVFPTDTGVRIIDWKTGKAPQTPEELEAKSIQLSAYRLAWSSWTGLSPENIEAAFWFVDDSAIVTPPRLIDFAELESRLGEALEAISNPTAAG
jgi:DNA helicase-2/ATP-dependent DNA helicase PcrA